MIYVVLTRECNMNCSYCYSKKSKTQITPQKLNDAIEYINRGNEPITIIGGEALIKKDELLYLLDNIGNRKITIITNGTIYIDFKKYNIDKIQISLDGFRDVHNKTKGNFDKIIENYYRYVNDEFIVYLHGVFIPETIVQFADSLELIVNRIFLNHALYSATLATGVDWNRHLFKLIYYYYKVIKLHLKKEFKVIKLPMEYTHPTHVCPAGSEILRGIDVVSGKVYSCHEFAGTESYIMGDYKKEMRIPYINDIEKYRFQFTPYFISQLILKRTKLSICPANNLEFTGNRWIIPFYTLYVIYLNKLHNFIMRVKHV